MVTLTIIRYPKQYIFFALLSMALFRLPLAFNKKISFFKLLGSGKNGQFVKTPDWQQWGIFTVSTVADENGNNCCKFINAWLRFFNCETWTVFLEPLQGHGKWDGKQPFGELGKQNEYVGNIAILTRATINLSKVKAFWKDIETVASTMEKSKGFMMALSIGEMPFIKQATFSVWESKESMMAFAYAMHQHSEVIKKTRDQKWYSEEMFIRFKIINSIGTISGKNPLSK